MTGAVDLVLPVAKIPEILAKYGRQMVFNGEAEGSGAERSSPGSVLRSKWDQSQSGSSDPLDSFSIRARSSRTNRSDVSSVVSSALASTASLACPLRSSSAMRASWRAT